MKKEIKILLLTGLLIAALISAWFIGFYTGKSQDNLPSLESISEMDEAKVNELLVGYRNYQLVDVWEEPDKKNGNTWIWKIDEYTQLEVSCSDKDKVITCSVDSILQAERLEILETYPARLQDVYSINILTESEAEQNYNQLSVIAESKGIWIEDYMSLGNVVNYAVVDLDKNGRVELIVSGMGGTGLYTTSRIFEINENYDGLTECVIDFGDGSEPDLAYYTWDRYMDEDHIFHYVVMDVEKNNPYGYYEEILDLTLENGVVRTSTIASRETIFKEEEPDNVICADAKGNAITEEEYENAVFNYFAGCEKTVVNIGWQNIEELAEDVDGIREQLEDSYALGV